MVYSEEHGALHRWLKHKDATICSSLDDGLQQNPPSFRRLDCLRQVRQRHLLEFQFPANLALVIAFAVVGPVKNDAFST
jgi:hypothetical protein